MFPTPSSGAAFAALFNASILVLIIYSFVTGRIRRDSKRPVWLTSIYAITIASFATTVLARALGLGHGHLMNRIGLVCFVIFGLCIAAEAVLELFDVKTALRDEIVVHGKGWLVPVILAGLLMAGIGTVVFMRSL